VNNIRPFVAEIFIDVKFLQPRWRAAIERPDIDNPLHFVANQHKAPELILDNAFDNDIR
jgi:hypothetical protein